MAQAYFRTKVRQHDNAPRPYGSLRIAVRREHVFEDSFHQLRSRTPDEIHMKLNVTFQVG
jgi:E3 ubiquitin-protein ligase HUWE1